MQLDTQFSRKVAHSSGLRTQLPAYRPEIDGLRAIAVTIVILCHAQFVWFQGGFVGVDVFFTISGYVVALSILRSLEHKTFNLIDFYARRLRRLAPSMYLVLAATLVFCGVYCFPEDTYNVLKNSLLASVFLSNIYLSKQTGYFAPEANKQALLHTWSLSVEEQFCLLLPLLFLALRNVSAAKLIVAISSTLLVALVLSQCALSAAPLQAYFKLQYRAFEFLIGTVLAVVHRLNAGQFPELVHELMVLTGLTAISYCAIVFSPQTPMPGLHVLIPCLGTALIIAGGRRARFASMLLTNRPMIYLGQLSYVAYLWHWPVIFALRRLQLESGFWMSLAGAMSLPLCMLTHHFLEQPFREMRWGAWKSFFRLLLVPIFLMGGIMFFAHETDNFSLFYPERYRLNYKATGHSVFETSRAKKCWSKTAITRPEDCSVGDMSIPVNAVIWGDSHAYHLIEFMDRLGSEHHLRLHDLTMTMCPPNEDGPAQAGVPFYQSYRSECLAHNKAVMAYVLSQNSIKTIIMSAVWGNYENPDNGREPKPTTHGYMPGDAYLVNTIKRLRAAGKRIIFVDDIPTAPLELENCLSNKLYLPTAGDGDCTYAESYALDQHRAAARILADMERRFPGAATIHTYDVPCRAGRCSTELQGIPIYRNHDTGHLGSGGSHIYYDAYKQKHPDELKTIFGESSTSRKCKYVRMALEFSATKVVVRIHFTIHFPDAFQTCDPGADGRP